MTRTASSHGAKLWLQAYNGIPLPPAHIKDEPQLLTEGRIQTAVDEWVVTG